MANDFDYTNLIKSLYLAGVSEDEIAKQFKLTRAVVNQFIQKIKATQQPTTPAAPAIPAPASTPLPKINANIQVNGVVQKGPSIAVIDDESIKKIVNASTQAFSTSKSYQHTIQPTAGKKIDDQDFSSFFSGYKTDTMNIFTKMAKTLEDLLKSFEKSEARINQQGKKQDAKDQRDRLDKIEEDREKPNRKNDEQDGWFEKIKNLIRTGAGGVGGALSNPSSVVDFAKNQFLGTALGAFAGNVVRSPFKTVGGLLKNPWLLAALAAGNEAWRSAGQTDYKPDPTSHNTDDENYLGRFLAGNGSKDWTDRIQHYAGLAGTGFLAGGAGGSVIGGVGAIPGAILGGLGGLGVAAGGELIGQDAMANIVGAVKAGASNVTPGMFMGVRSGDIGISEDRADRLRKEIAETDVDIKAKNKKMDGIMDAMAKLRLQVDDANKRGDKAGAAALQAQMDALSSEGGQTQIAIGAAQKKRDWSSQDLDRGIRENAAQTGADIGGDILTNVLKKKHEKAMGELGAQVGKLVGPKIDPNIPLDPGINAQKMKVLQGSIYAPVGQFLDDAKSSIESIFNWDNFLKTWYSGSPEAYNKIAPAGAQLPVDPSKPHITMESYLKSKEENKGWLSNLFTSTEKPKTKSIQEMARDANQGSNAFGQMLGAMSNIQNQNTSVNNTVNNKTVVARPPLATDQNFGGYGRGGF